MHHGAGHDAAEGLHGLPGLERRVGHAQLLEDALGGVGHGRADVPPQWRARTRPGNTCTVFRRGWPSSLLAQHPGLGLVDVAVAVAHQLPDLGQGARRTAARSCSSQPARAGLSKRSRSAALSSSVSSPRAGSAPPKYFSIIATVRLTRLPRSLARSAFDAVEQRLVGVVAVRAEGHLAHQVIAQGVHAVALPRSGRDIPRCPWICSSCRRRTAASRGRTPAWAAAGPARAA